MAQNVVYNFVFPSYCNEITIAGYFFKRVPEYQERLQRLDHRSDDSLEFHIHPNTGTHAITATVGIPIDEKKACLPWDDKDSSALQDILLLLSLFTTREVFALDEDFQKDIDGILVKDPRRWNWGGTLRCSIPYKALPIEGNYPHKFDIGFQEGIEKIYSLICSEEWKNTYENGYYLFLSRSAFRLQDLNDSFIHCWIIWEHLFSVLNSKWMSQETIVHLNATEKISFIMVFYNLVDQLDKKQKKRIADELVTTRNRLIHYGQFPSPSEKYFNHAKVFIHLTETIIAKSLGLNPSNVLNTQENLQRFFDGTLNNHMNMERKVFEEWNEELKKRNNLH